MSEYMIIIITLLLENVTNFTKQNIASEKVVHHLNVLNTSPNAHNML